MISRALTKHLRKMLKLFPVVSLTGPRQSGKTTLLKNEFPKYKYFNLERIDLRQMVLADTMGFLRNAGEKVIFDEAQNLPELFSYIQVISDERGTPGQYILSGSQSFLLNTKISQSLAGRVSINHLLPFDISELPEKNFDKEELILKGFYPRIYDKNIKPKDFYPSYLQTYIERDIRTLKSIENLNTFTRFLGLCAGRVGQILNISSLANDTGISVNTAKGWLSLLEASFVIYFLKPYYRNFNKRIVKAPKLYFYDTGIVSSLLGISDKNVLRNHYAYGSLFENLIISEILKAQIHSGKRPSVFYWRESNGTEIDCIIDNGNNQITALEIKAGETFSQSFANNLLKFNVESSFDKVRKIILYSGKDETRISKIRVASWNNFGKLLKQII